MNRTAVTDGLPVLSARDLRAVVAVAEYSSFIAAAAALKTSQPAVTRAIKRMEKSLGVLLFARSTRRVELTAAGDCARQSRPLTYPAARSVTAGGHWFWFGRSVARVRGVESRNWQSNKSVQ